MDTQNTSKLKMPKKIAIIGAGPSGLVTAKTMLHSFPGTFSPVIFDSQDQPGGLWNHTPSNSNGAKKRAVTLDPQMPTNLSRFTVAFSDFAWESVIHGEPPVFPQARQVGRYLSCYADRYIPQDVFRLGCRVVKTEREVQDGVAKWNVQWLRESGSPSESMRSEHFDFLVVASGYFAQQYIPSIPGLEKFSGPVIHSSTLHQQRENLLQVPENNISKGKTLVIGGSMSGVEAASAVVLSRSSSMLSANEIPSMSNQVHHIYSRPFWTLPTYLPHGSEETPFFQPLDLAMYDLGRRPPGPIEYYLGPIPEEKAAKTNIYFQSLLGSDYEKYAHMSAPGQTQIQPPWVAISNDYAEFVRSESIVASMGRVISVQPDDVGLAAVQYTEPNGQVQTIINVAAIVMATGFTPFKSLSLLPEDVLSQLEYSATDPFSPLILDKGGTVRSEISDIGFVGFYRGPYWGVMEMQARFLGKLWSGNDIVYTKDQTQSIRSLRAADADLARGQFPMGDYVGLMESFADDMAISRSVLGEDRSGPAIPARYLYDTLTDTRTFSANEADKTVNALRDALMHDGEVAQKAAASAIFRALHGLWKPRQAEIGDRSGNLVFYPRHPTNPAYNREYVCVETRVSTTGQGTSQKVRSIMRLAETGSRAATSEIEMWSVDLADGVSAGEMSECWHLTPLRHELKGEERVPGKYMILAKSIGFESIYWYTFHFEGVSISSWECAELEIPTEDKTELDSGKNYRSQTVYER